MSIENKPHIILIPLTNPAGNLLRSSNVSPLEAQQATLAGRKWLRAYVNGCAFQLWEVSPVSHHKF